MKRTITTLAVIVALILSWMLLAGIYYVTTDITYKQCLSENGVIFFMLMFGWTPAVMVASDLEDKFKTN
jgi:hypothetical protein